MWADRVARDLSELRDRPLGGVGVLDDASVPQCWLLFVRPSRGVLRDGVFIFRVMFGERYPEECPVVSGLSLDPHEFYSLAANSWTPAHTMRGYAADLRHALEAATLVEAARLVDESRRVFENDFDSAVYIPSDEVRNALCKCVCVRVCSQPTDATG